MSNDVLVGLISYLIYFNLFIFMWQPRLWLLNRYFFLKVPHLHSVTFFCYFGIVLFFFALLEIVMTQFMKIGSELLVLIYLSLELFLMGMVFAPMGAFLPEIFPTNVRYTGSSATYSIGLAITPSIDNYLLVNVIYLKVLCCRCLNHEYL